jgi:hypothetical protein
MKQMTESKERVESWTYTCSCLVCDWKVTYAEGEWQRGAASIHADRFGHRVKTVSEKIISPTSFVAKEPTSKDREIAFCETCKRYLGVGAGRMFAAAWRSHYASTQHDITVKPNPAYKKPRKNQ